MRVRSLVAVSSALLVFAMLAFVAVVLSPPPRAAIPVQQTGTAAGRSHRVSASGGLGRIVDGHFVPDGSGASRPLSGPVAADDDNFTRVPGAVPATGKPKSLTLPARGKSTPETVSTLKAPPAERKAGFNPKTSLKLSPSRANQVVYANADGTKTAFEYENPVNYRLPDGKWASISTSLVPASSASASSLADRWAERSQAYPQSFAASAGAPDLVTVPVDDSHTLSFGISGASAVTGVASGSTVSYADVRPDSAVSFTAGTGLMKESIVLSSPSAPDTWVFPLTLKGLRAQTGPGGIVEFADSAGKVLAYVPHGFMTDSNIDPRSGNGATSFGVTYSLITVGGRQAIKMTLDTAWLDSKSRVYPVTVDPSVSDEYATTTFLLSPFFPDVDNDSEIDVGTYDGGANVATSYLDFTDVAADLHDDTVLGARLGVFNTWSYSCSPREVYVYPVTSSWTAGQITSSSQVPSTGAAVGRSSFATGWQASGASSSPCPNSWEGIGLDQSGTNLVNGWTHDSSPDYGLALGASSSDSYAWKKFASDSTSAGKPVLAVTYTTDGASYKLASRRAVTNVTPTSQGSFKIAVTNTGSSTWDSGNANGYEISSTAYYAYGGKGMDGTEVPGSQVFTPLPATVTPTNQVTVTANVAALKGGPYRIVFDMYSGMKSGQTPQSFSSQGIQYFEIGLYVPEPPPVVSAVYPPTGFIPGTLQQQLSTTATGDGTVTYDFKLTCKPLPGQTCIDSSVSSGSISNPYWTPPKADLDWNTPYQWTVAVTSKSGTASSTTTVGPVDIEPEVPQPAITSGLGGSSGQDYDPLSGNYTTSATDAAVNTVGPPLEINRTYNSLDPRSSGAFGAGWSSLVDTSLRNNGPTVTVTLPDGQQLTFGENGDGTYAAPMGSSDALVESSSGTWTLRDASGDLYAFTSAGLISSITDVNGYAQDFSYGGPSGNEVQTITDVISGRALTLTWSQPSGAMKFAHVSSVTTPPQTPGGSGFTWTYSYTGDALTGACAPAPTGPECTTYTYGSGSHYWSSVLDANPRVYYQLGESSGATTAADEVSGNLGTTDGTYKNVTLGATGPLAGSSATAAAFNGTSSYLSLPNDLLTDDTDVSIGLWFKSVPGKSGVLFAYSAGSLASGSEGNHAVPALYIGANGELYGEIFAGSAASAPHSSTAVNDGNWHYAVLSASSNSQALYLDGIQQGTLSGQVNPLNMVNDSVGAGFWGSGWPQAGTAGKIGYFDGDIGQVAVYAEPLSAATVASQYALGTATSPELTQVTLPSGKIYEKACYDADTARLTGYTDPAGGKWSISPPLTTGTKASSDALGYVVDDVSVTDPAGRHETYGYDMTDGGRLISYDNGVDGPQAYGYDAAGFLTTTVDQDGNLVCLTNDIHGNVLTRTWYPDEPQTLPGTGPGIAPASCGGSTASSPDCWTTGAACTTFYGYSTYNPANPVDPTNNELTSVRDGRSSSSTDPTYETTYEYNTIGQLVLETTPPTSDFPDGRVTRYTYSTGTETAANGGQVPAGLLMSTTTPGGAVTSYSYDTNGDLAQVTQPSGESTTYTYDGLGRPVTEHTSTYPSGEDTTYSYMPTGQQASVTYPPIANSVTGVTHQLEDTYSYDADNDVLTRTQTDLTGGDPSRTTTYTYNDHDQVASVTQPAGATTGGTSQSQGATSANPDGATTGYGYDAFGNVNLVTDPNGNEYKYEYNEYQEPTQEMLYTPSTDESSQDGTCTPPATQDQDGGCDLVLESYAYDPAGLLRSETDAMGRITDYVPDNDQKLAESFTVQPCSASDPCTSMSPCTPTAPCTSGSVQTTTNYSYDGAGNMISEEISGARNGAAVTSTTTDYNYDAADRLTSVVQDATPAGASSSSGYLNRTTAYTYNADNHVLSQTVGTSAQGGPSVTDYTYDTAGDQTSQTVQDGSTSLETTWTYANGLPQSMTTPAGNASGATAADYTTSYAYDPAGNLVTVKGPPVQTQTYAAQLPVSTRPVTAYGYDTYGDQTQVEDPDGNVTVTGYDGNGRVTSVTQPSYTQPGSSTAIAATTSYGYDEDGNLTSVTYPSATNPASNVTQYTYDALGDVTSMTQPQLPGQSAPGTWTYTYDADGEQLTATDPLGNTSHATYDYFGRLASSTDPLGNVTGYAYDDLGDLTQESTPDGAVTTNTYDDLGELTSSANGTGDTSSYQYDYAGQLAYAYNPDGNFSQYGYDEAGNLTSVADYGAAPAGQASAELRSESFGYDPDGDLTSVKDWDGNTTGYAYNAAGELTSQLQPVSSSSSITTSYGYDPAGNQTAVTGGNQNATWTTYNPWNLPESVIEPATPTAPAAANRTWTTAYNVDGQAATVTQPGGITQAYLYDPLGDVLSETGSGASAATAARSFSYDLDGRMTGASAPGGTDTFSYNADSELTGASGPSGASGYTYNGDGLVASETSSAGTTSYTYDSSDRLATVADPLTGATLTYSYNADSQPLSIGYASGGTAGPVQAFTYDNLNRLTGDTVTSASGTTLASQTYGYDADGNLTSQATGGLMGATSASYGYDEASRLISATTNATTTQYAYDGDGNLTQAGATSYAYNAQDQLTSSATASGTTSYGYTLSGALASVTAPGGSAQDYTSDAFGQAVTMPGGVSYSYDALGRPVTRGTGSGSTSMSYVGASDTLASDGRYDYSYTPSGALTAAGTIGGSAYATMLDQHGDVAATFSPTSTARGLAGYATYSPYGTASSTGYQPGIGYQGDYTDPSTGLVMMGARWYNPATGSFVTNDQVSGSPLSSTTDGNPYAYTSGNPLTETDPTGHSCIPIDIDGVIGLGGCRTGTQGGSQGGSQGGISWGGGSQGGGQAGWGMSCQSYDSCGASAGYQTFSQWSGWASLQQQLNEDYEAWWDSSGSWSNSSSSAGGPCTGDCGGGGGGNGPCGYDCTSAAPYQPPPPPQDCYAGPDPTCTPPSPPGALLNGTWITYTVRGTSLSQLEREHLFITEQEQKASDKVSGLRPNATTTASSPESDSGDDYLPFLLQPLHDLRPGLPVPPGPGAGNNNKNAQKLARQAAQAATPIVQTLLAPVFNAAQSVLTNGVNCVTQLQLGSCLQTLATLLPYATGAGEVAGLTDATDLTAAEGVPARGVTFFDESTAEYYKVPNATLGRPGGSTFFMSEEDSALVTNSSNAARYTGMAPSVQRAYVNGESIYGVNFPTSGLEVRAPTAADAGGFEHFLEGGQTAVRLANDGGYLVNPVQEFVTPGGLSVPEGSFLFRLGPGGEQIPIRSF
jgi:RHS repeat-associated protein